MKSRRRSFILLFMLPFIFSSMTESSASKNEIPVVLLPVKSSPLITFRIQFFAGSINDPQGKRGLTALTAALITQGGTRDKSYEEIVDLLYPMATRVHSQVGKEVTTIIGTVHQDNLAAYYSILREMLLEPGFREGDFERLRTNQINYLEKRLRGNDDENLGKEALNTLMYEGHPYDHPVEGLVHDLKKITVDDVKHHYKKVLTRENVVLGLAGGYDETLLATIKKDLSKLPAEGPVNVLLPDAEGINGVEVLLVEKECRSTAISMGYPIVVTRNDADFYPLMIANSYLGEHRTFNGVLMLRMRERRGLNYGDYSYIEHFVQAGGSIFPVTNIPRNQQYFSIWIRPVLHDNRHFSIRLALWELEKLMRDGISREAFEETTEFLINYSTLYAQNDSRRLGYLMDSHFYGIGNFLEDLPQKLKNVTLEQVNTAIKRHLNRENIKIAVITKDAESLLKDLITNRPSPIHYEAENIPEEILIEDKKIAAYQLKINKEKSKVIRAEDLFEK